MTFFVRDAAGQLSESSFNDWLADNRLPLADVPLAFAELRAALHIRIDLNARNARRAIRRRADKARYLLSL